MKERNRRDFLRLSAGALGGGLAWAVGRDGRLLVPRVAEASPIRRIVPLQAHEVPEQITRIIETPQNISLVFWKAERVSAPSEAAAEFEKLKPALLVQSVWSYDEARGDWTNYTVGAPEFASLLKAIPPGETRLFVVANRRPIETPVAPQTPTPTPAPAGGSEKFPAPPTQGSDTPPREPTPEFKEGVNREAGRLAVERLNDYRVNGAKIFVYDPDGRRVRYGGGLAPLRANPILERTAEKYARVVAYNDPYLRSKNPHGLDGNSWDRAEREGYTNQKAFAEVLGSDFDLFLSVGPNALAEGAINGFFWSPPHREILLGTKYTEVGFGLYLIEGTKVGPDRDGRIPQVLVVEVGLVGSR